MFSVQLDYAAASAPRLDADTRIAKATVETLKVPGRADQASFADFNQYSLHVVGEFWLLVLCERRFFTWSTESCPSHVIW